MNKPRFSSLLQSKGLFFCRADKFSDPFEGSLPKKEAEFRPIQDRAIADHFEREFDEEQRLRNILTNKFNRNKSKLSYIFSVLEEQVVEELVQIIGLWFILVLTYVTTSLLEYLFT